MCIISTLLLISLIGSTIAGVIVAFVSIFVGIIFYGFQVTKNCKTLGAPNKAVNDVIHSMKESEEPAEMIKFIHKYDEKYHTNYRYSDKDYEEKAFYHWMKMIDHKWLKTFIAVCHWSGLRIVLTKDHDHDIEDSDSLVYDEEKLYRFSEQNKVINEKILSEQEVQNKREKYRKDSINKFLEV